MFRPYNISTPEGLQASRDAREARAVLDYYLGDTSEARQRAYAPRMYVIRRTGRSNLFVPYTGTCIFYLTHDFITLPTLTGLSLLQDVRATVKALVHYVVTLCQELSASVSHESDNEHSFEQEKELWVSQTTDDEL